jgi:hypothetical protein
VSRRVEDRDRTDGYATLAGAIDELARRGFTERFRLVDGEFQALGTREMITPKDLVIREYHRFEGISDPDDMAIVYALESKGGIRGTLADAFGVYSDPGVSAALADVPIRTIPAVVATAGGNARSAGSSE